MARFLNGVLFNPTLGGTTDFTVSAAVAGYMTPASAGVTSGAVYRYRAENATLTEWEIGYGVYTAGVLARTVVLYNSLGTTAKINFTTAPNVGMGMPLASDIFPFVSDTPPTSPDDGALWWESDTGVLYIYYNDGTSSQWVGIQSQTSISAVLYSAQALNTSQQAQARANIGIKFGQCILSKVSTNIVLLPKNGDLLSINGMACSIPAAGVSLAPTGLTPGTLYYIYAVATAGVVTSLEASATGHSTSSTAGNVGVEIKTGDDTRSLVGMVRPITGPAFVDLSNQKFVRSWYNGGTYLQGISYSGSTSSTSFVEVSTAARVEFLCWPSELLDLSANGSSYNSTASQSTYSSIGFDGTAVATGLGGGGSAAVNVDIPTSHRVLVPLAEGYHYASIYGKVTGGAGTWYSGSVPLLNGRLG